MNYASCGVEPLPWGCDPRGPGYHSSVTYLKCRLQPMCDIADVYVKDLKVELHQYRVLTIYHFQLSEYPMIGCAEILHYCLLYQIGTGQLNLPCLSLNSDSCGNQQRILWRCPLVADVRFSRRLYSFPLSAAWSLRTDTAGTCLWSPVWCQRRGGPRDENPRPRSPWTVAWDRLPPTQLCGPRIKTFNTRYMYMYGQTC